MDITKDNKGTSLVELVIAMMISAIIILMITFFLNNASKSFRITNDDVNLQMEAQSIINQLSNLVMEAEYMENEGGEAVNSHMMTYTDFEGMTRYIFKHINRQEDGSEVVEYNTIVLSKPYLYQIISYDWLEAKDATIIKNKHLLAEYVEELFIDIVETEQVSRNKSVNIEVGLALGRDTASLTKRVKFRNSR